MKKKHYAFMFWLSMFLAKGISAQATVPDFLWATKAGGIGWDEGYCIFVDSAGNSYIAGEFHETAIFGGTELTTSGLDDIFITKLDVNGNCLWAKKAGGASSDYAYNISIDSAGNSYVTGRFEGSATFGGTVLTSSGGSDIFITKFDTNGNFLWTKKAGGTLGDWGLGVSVDFAGNSYVTGRFEGSATFGGTVLTSSGGSDIFIAKFDTNGNFLWATKAGGASRDWGSGVSVDSVGNSYVTGGFEGTATFGATVLISMGGDDFFITKLDTDGNFLWATRAGGYNWYESGSEIFVDSSGNSYVTGAFQGGATFGGTLLNSSGSWDIYITKFDTNGNCLWAKKAGGTSGDFGVDISIDSAGNSYVTGSFEGSATFGGAVLTSSGNSDIFITKLDTNGNFLWAKKAGGASVDFCSGITADFEGNSYITGRFDGSATFGGTVLSSSGSSDIFITKLGISGQVGSITVTNPTSGTIWTQGTTRAITWTQTGLSGDVTIDLYKGGVFNSNIGTASATALTYSWPIPAGQTVGSDYKVRIYQGSVEDYSDTNFSITSSPNTYDIADCFISNVSSIADRFTIWVKVTKNGLVVEPTEEGLRIVDGSNNLLAQVVDDTLTSVVVNNVLKWRATFVIEKRNQYGNFQVPYFENGLLQIFNKNNPSQVFYTASEDKLSLSVFGTDFRMTRDAYPFSNGNWNRPVAINKFEDNYFKATETVDNYVEDYLDSELWKSIGYMQSAKKNINQQSEGLCYGMANSSISNYTHRLNEAQGWGELDGNTYSYWNSETDNSWQKAIDDRWPQSQSIPNGPHKSYKFNDIFNLTDSEKNEWTLEACKKILYYYVSQPFFNGNTQWPGKDLSEKKYILNDLLQIIKMGNPISFLISSNEGRHAVIVTQVIKWKNNCKFVVYDNNYPYRDGSSSSNFLEMWLFLNNANVLEYRQNYLRKVNKEDGIGVWSSRDLFVVDDAEFLTTESDSQKIYYNPGVGSPKAQMNAPQAKPIFSHFDWSNRVNQLNETFSSGYIEITMIGASSFRVFNNSSNLEIAVIRDGNLDGSQAVYNHEPDTILTMLYLPVSTGIIYRVEVLKDAQIPRLKIFPNVPKDNGTLEASGFDNIQVTNEDATKAVFLVGKDNTDHSLQRTSGSGASDSINAQFVEAVPVPVPAVDNFNAVVNGLNVSLSWDNPTHPHFSQVKIIRKADTPPASDSDGTQVYLGTASSATDVLPAAGTYYYGAFSYDSTSAVADWTTIMVDGTLYTISGNVTSSSTGLANATIKLDRDDGMSWQTLSSGDGKYSFTNIGNGNYVATCEANGYTIVNPSRNFSINNASYSADFQASLVNTITLTNPNGGENWIIGTSQNINWTDTGTIANVNIDYSTNSGGSWTPVVASTANDGSYAWTVPATPSTTCMVRISDAANAATQDGSDAVFTIAAAASETVSSPSRPAGAKSGLKATSYPFTTGGSTSSLGHTVQYKFDWNDGTDSGWLSSGTTSASHSWDANGTYIVKTIARCVTHTTIESLWSDTHSITISDSGTLGKYNSPSQQKILPEVIWAPATGGGTWMSEVQVTDISGGSQVSVYYSTAAGRRGPFALWTNGGGALRSQKFNNMLQTIDGLDSGTFTYYGTVGAVEFVTQDAAHVLQVMARTLNGSYSKTFSGLSLHDSNTADLNRKMILTNLTSNSSYRSFCGMYNSSPDAVTVELRLRNAINGQIGTTITKTLNGYGFISFNPFNEAGVAYPANSYDNVILSVQPTSGTGKVLCFGASANNASNDPAAHIAVQNHVNYDNGASSEQILLEAIWAPATGGGTWMSEVQIVAVTGGSTVEASFNYGGGNHRGPFELWTGSVAGSKVKFANILQQLGTIDSGFNYYGHVGTVQFRTQHSMLFIQVTARTVNGNYSKTFPGLNWVEAESADTSRVMIIQNFTNNSAYRSTCGFFNTNYGETVEFTLLNGNGTQIGTPFNKTFVGSDFQAFSPFNEAGVPYPVNSFDNVILMVRPTSGNGWVLCFGASANNASNDPAAHLAVQGQ